MMEYILHRAEFPDKVVTSHIIPRRGEHMVEGDRKFVIYHVIHEITRHRLPSSLPHVYAAKTD